MASANTTTSAGADAAGPAPDAVNTPATSGAAAGAGAGAGAGSAAAATVPASASAMEPALHSVAANGITIAYYELLPPASSTSSSGGSQTLAGSCVSVDRARQLTNFRFAPHNSQPRRRSPCVSMATQTPPRRGSTSCRS